MQKQSTPWYVWVILLGGIWLAAGRPGVDLLPSIATKSSHASYVYEKDDGAPPASVVKALKDINADKALGIIAAPIDKDIIDGTGQVPEQYAAAIEAAKAAGLPVLVLHNGPTVSKVLKVKDGAAILEAVK